MTYIRVEIEETGGKINSGWYTGVALEVTNIKKRALCYLEDELAIMTATRLTQVFHKGVESVTATVERKI